MCVCVCVCAYVYVCFLLHTHSHQSAHIYKYIHPSIPPSLHTLISTASFPAASETAIVIHDAFRFTQWQGFMQPSAGYINILLDTHIYQAFVYETMNATYQTHLDVACGWSAPLKASSTNLWTMVGEWSLGKHLKKAVESV